MPATKRVDDRPEGSPEGQRLSRRLFVRDMAVFSAAVLAGTGLLKRCGPSTEAPPAAPTLPATAPTASPTEDTALPTAPTAPAATPAAGAAASTATPAVPTPTAPAASGSATLGEAIQKRRSTNAFQPQPLPREKLLDLLWAAWGINRPDSGKRTAPSAMNAQEIDLYVLLADGTYLYEAGQNQLTPVSGRDLRATIGAVRFQDAPVHLIFVADYARYRGVAQSQKELWSAAHTGFIGQNVYLFCASEGLGAHFYASVDRAALKDSLQLRADQAVVFGQAVGYPAE